MKTEWECIDLECTHWDGDRCTLGFCEPDTLSFDLEYVEEGELQIPTKSEKVLISVGKYGCPHCNSLYLVADETEIARKLILRIISSWYKERGQGTLDMRSFADYAMRWLDEAKKLNELYEQINGGLSEE